MRRLLIISSLIGSLIIFALSIDLFDALFMFVFFGVLPMRADPIPANQMLLVYSVAGLIVMTFAFRNSLTTLYHLSTRKRTHAKAS